MPWIIDPATLPNNVHRAVAVLKGLEKRMRKAGTDYMKLYEEQFQDMVTRKVVRKLSQEEISQYTGPVFYLSHFEVNNPEKTTKMRIVCNASATYMQTKLNDCWVKGPLITNDLLGVLLRFREKLIAIVGDLSKMYQSVLLSELDQHTHRLVWRNFDTSKEPDHYVLQTVTFGDKPSGTIATLALRKTADMFQEKFPNAVRAIKEDTYIDDIMNSVDTNEEKKSIIQKIEQIVNYGGL